MHKRTKVWDKIAKIEQPKNNREKGTQEQEKIAHIKIYYIHGFTKYS